MDNLMHVLEGAGWYNGRKINTDHMIEGLKREGFNVPNESVRKQFEEYWNLELNFTSPGGKLGNIILNIDEVLGSDEKIINRIGTLLNEKLVPVGTINFDSALLLVSDKENYYMAANGNLYLIASDFHEALSTIMNEKNVIKIDL